MNKQFLCDVVTTIVLATLFVALSIGNGILSVESPPNNPLVVQKFQWTTIMTYQCLVGVFMAWTLWQHEVPVGEPIVYLLAPIVLYYYFQGSVIYYLALFAIANVTLWRTLHHVRHTSKRMTEEIEKEEATA
jgi:sterol desaturase/sphingolipid hydroxylase (fatty acid hydroxylase superfamily)